jgi:5-methyltetrahydrofolate--homocysteine methyltransferase
MLLIETCTDLETTLSAAGAAARLEPTLLAVTAHFGADCKMADGTTPEQFAASLEQVGAHIVGANCGHTPEQFVEITARMRQAATTPLLIQPSAGLPEPDAAGTGRYSVGPDRFAEVAARLLDAGADVVGGCCGTTPAYIAAVSERAISPRVRKPTA